MQVEFDQTSGRLTFSDRERTDATIENGLAWVSYCLRVGELRQIQLTGLDVTIEEQLGVDIHGTCLEWSVRCPAKQDGIELTYHVKRYDHQPFLLLQLSARNLGYKPVYLQELCLFQSSHTNGGCVILPATEDGLRFFKVGWHGWDYTGWRASADRNQLTWLEGLTRLSYSNPATPKPKRKGEFCSEGWAILEGAHAVIIAGFASTAHQFGQVFACVRPGEEALSLICQADGIRLDSGESYESDWGYLQFLSLPNPFPEAAYLEAVNRQMCARVPASPPPLMWTHWYQFYHNIDERRFLQNLDQLADQRESIPFQMVELDDGYQLAWGDWTRTNAKFPHGLEWLAKEIYRMGFSPGLWLAPFAVQRDSQLAREHPDWIVKDKNGKPARVGFLYNMFIYALDLTRPEVLEHLQQLAHTLTHAWGFKMLKIDFLNCAALPGERYNPKLTRAEALRQGLGALRHGSGEGVFLLGCGCPFGPAIGVVDAMRIGPDTAPSWEPYFHWLPWTRRLIKSNPSMPALRNAMRNTLELSSLNRKWWWNDPDCLLVRDADTHLTEVEVQSMVSLVGLSGGMVVSSDGLDRVSLERLQWLSNLVPNLGLEGATIRSSGDRLPRIYQVKLENARQVYQLVALFNWTDRRAEYQLCFSELGYAENAKIHVYDFWRQQYQCITEPEMRLDPIPAHGCMLLRLCEVGQSPQLVGDTLHVSQGLELNSLRIVDHTLAIETIDLGRRVEGELWFVVDKTVSMARCNGEAAKVEERGEGVYAVKVGFMRKALIEIDM
ncbi:MAG TPA: alpha-galactosidase [Anaerolineales bacterium]|nr:alpha-galactosidase [Anaerolineales bacterium]